MTKRTTTPDPEKEFLRLNQDAANALFKRAFNAGLVLGHFKHVPGLGLVPGPWQKYVKYPPAFLRMCSEAARTPKQVARDARAYWHYIQLGHYILDAPALLIDKRFHPMRLRRGTGWTENKGKKSEVRVELKKLHIGHFRVMGELAERYGIHPYDQLSDLMEAAQSGTGAAAMARIVEEKAESGKYPDLDPEPIRKAKAIINELQFLSETDLDNDRYVQRAAMVLLLRIQRWLA